MTRLWFLLTILLCSLFIQVESAKTASGERPVYEEVYFRCLVNSINGQYTHVGSRYEVHGRPGVALRPIQQPDAHRKP